MQSSTSSTGSTWSVSGRALFGAGLIGSLLFVGAGMFAMSQRTLQAAPPTGSVSIRYLGVRDDGSTAKAWYAGAPAAGVPIQDALDHFAKQGFRIGEVSRRFEVVDNEASVWTILLERVR